LAAGAALSAVPAHAQDVWPSRPITLVVPYAPGGYTDLVGRLTARYMQKVLGKTVLVDNRTGAGGIVGTQAVATAAPDGYTICVCSIGAITIAPFVQKVGYDPVRDLEPIGVISSIAQVVMVKKDLPVNSMAEFVAYAKANPGKLNYSSSGAGGLTHYSVELFEINTGIRAVHIPFKGGAPATTALVAGEVDFSFGNMTDALPQVEARTIRGLAVTSLKRSPFLPDMPTIHETVLPNYGVDSWNALMAPAKTPPSIIRAISDLMIKMADDPEVIEGMKKAGSGTIKQTPEQFRAQIAQEIEQWTPFVKALAEKK
jgi:tripartite-type tricarboxylate transporter receptor subunit TctC